MLKKYSIAEARHDLAAIVKELERQPAIQITRRGQPVAVLVSAREFERLSTARSGFWAAYKSFCQGVDLARDGVDDSFLMDLRQKDSGRRVDL
jgi:prevent-host-death family protein